MTRLIKKPIFFLPFAIILIAGGYFVGKTIPSGEFVTFGSRAEAVEETTANVKTDIPPVIAWDVYSNATASSSWYQGTVKIDKDRKISFNVPGVITEIYIKPGMRLWAEKVIARLESSENRDNIRQLETAYGKARYEALKAVSNYYRLRDLRKTNAATVDELNAAGQTLTKAQLAERTLKKQLQMAQQNLGDRELIMAEKGTVTAVLVKAGDRVEAGQAIASFTPTYPVLVTVTAPAILLTQIFPNGKGRVRFKSISDRAYPAGGARIGNVSSAQGRGTVTLALSQPGLGLQTGADAEASFQLESKIRDGRFIIPPDAIGTDGIGSYVYVVKPADGVYGVLERRTISQGALTGFGQEVTSGLSDGDVVVMRGINRLQNGMKVRWK